MMGNIFLRGCSSCSVENRLWGVKGRSGRNVRRHCSNPGGSDSDPDEGGSGAVDGKGFDSACILHVESVGIAGKLTVRSERKKEKDVCRVFGEQQTGRITVKTTEMGKA